MKSKDVVIGMAVIPHGKSNSLWQTEEGLAGSAVWHRAKLANQPYLHVTGWDSTIKVWVLSESQYFGEPSGDYFLAKDFEPYTTPYKMVKFLDTGTEFRQFQVGDLQVYRFIDVFLATGWPIVFANWPINVSRVVTPIYIEGEYIQAYEMEFGNLVEEIK